MGTRHHPAQKLCWVSRTSLLLAASGSRILTYNLETGKLLSHGPPFDENTSKENHQTAGSAYGPSPTKRRKFDHPNSSRETSDGSVEIVAERKKGERRKPKVKASNLPNVSHLIASSNGRNVIAVTTEDKCITVYSLILSGRLLIESRRSMPKRLCSIALSPDEQTIIAADKFGDVYSLPLYPSDEYIALQSKEDATNGEPQPSATALTVHTKGNLEALRQQQEQKKRKARKDGPAFEHKLLLGHVSLLTDVTIASTEDLGKQRHFILTADRDEHVRVSRYPQTHVIHGYCLSFRDFVSKICIVPWNEKFLIVGSGEPSLNVFDWQLGTLLSQFTFDDQLQEMLQGVIADDVNERSLAKLAVSGIWPASINRSEHRSSPEEDGGGIFLVALEGFPYLFSLCLTRERRLQCRQSISLSGNVLDVAVNVEEQTMAMISVDNVHLPGSMLRQRTDVRDSDFSIITLELDSTTLQWSRPAVGFSLKSNDVEDLQELLPETPTEAARSSRARGEYSALGEFLYGLENLRKTRGLHTEDIEQSVEGAEEGLQEEF